MFIVVFSVARSPMVKLDLCWSWITPLQRLLDVSTVWFTRASDVGSNSRYTCRMCLFTKAYTRNTLK